MLGRVSGEKLADVSTPADIYRLGESVKGVGEEEEGGWSERPKV